MHASYTLIRMTSHRLQNNTFFNVAITDKSAFPDVYCQNRSTLYHTLQLLPLSQTSAFTVTVLTAPTSHQDK